MFDLVKVILQQCWGNVNIMPTTTWSQLIKVWANRFISLLIISVFIYFLVSVLNGKELSIVFGSN